jgi:hypothetical protein
MESPDHHDDPAGERARLTTLIDNYRVQHSAWRAQGRTLAQMRADVVAAADLEAHGIVEAARREVRDIVLKARRDLLVIAAQLQATSEASEAAPDGGADTGALQMAPDDLGAVHHLLASARHDVRRALADARPDLAALSSEAAALRAGLRGATTPPAGLPPQVPHPAPQVFENTAPSPAVDERRTARTRRFFAAVVVILGLTIAAVTAYWVRRPIAEQAPPIPASLAAVAAATSPTLLGATATPLVADNIEAPSPLVVRMDVRRTVWIRTRIDGRVASARLFEAGETQQIHAAQQVSIRAGDAGGVFVSVNGSEATPLGRDGQVVTRAFEVGERVKAPPADTPAATEADATQRP